MTQIQWTKCSERMPPDDGNPIIIEFYSLLSQKAVFIAIFDATLKYAYFRSLKRKLDSVNWTPYTPEAWKELSR